MSDTHGTSPIDPNYAYWREHGGEWGAEYEGRKHRQIYYHIQELMLADYFAASAPAAVLEFGCGTGRHLRYLRGTRGIDVYGFDQSASMASNILTWADREWFDDHVTVGEPVGRLPYDDGQFDIAFTSEVLVHVRPEHLDSILTELIRVSRWQTLHLEPGPTTTLTPDEHAGCWYHDLVAAYGRLGHNCEVLDSGISVHQPYRVVLAKDREPHRWSDTNLGLWRRLESELQPQLDEIPALAADHAYLQGQIVDVLSRDAELETEMVRQRTYLHELESELVSADTNAAEAETDLLAERRWSAALNSELYQIKSSAGFRLLNAGRSSALGRAMKPLARAAAKAVSRASSPGQDFTPAALPPDLPPLEKGHVRLAPLFESAERRVGSEVWILAIENPDRRVPYDLVPFAGSGELKNGMDTPTGNALALFEHGSFLDLPAVEGDEVVLLRHASGGRATMEWGGNAVQVNLHGPEGRVRCTLAESSVSIEVEGTVQQRGGVSPYRFWADSGYSSLEQEWMERYSQNPRPLSIGHPEWWGIRSSASQLFDECIFLRDQLDDQSAGRHARLIIEAGCPALVIQGFPATYIHLVMAMRRLAPSIPVFVIWHGNFLQAREDYPWQSFRTVDQLARDGHVARLGFVKVGMAEVLAAHGLKTGFIMNLVRAIPEGPSQPDSAGPHVGIWNIAESWHKLPYAMIAGTSLIPGAVVHMSGASERALEILDYWGLERRLRVKPVPHDEMPSRLARMHVNLNVTLSECAPMVPLESLSVGAPCLLGPTSHYFEDHNYLKSRLVVPSADSGSSIGRLLKQAIEERDQIVDAYRQYAPGYNERAFEALETFLEMPVKQGA